MHWIAVLTMFDLSLAFDTVEHARGLSRLSDRGGGMVAVFGTKRG